MNWNSSEFIWLDWAVLAVGVILIAWAVYRAIQKDKKLQQGANSEDYLFGKGEPWYIIGAAIFAANIGSRRCRHGTLGNARMDDSYSRMVVCPVLSIIEQ